MRIKEESEVIEGEVVEIEVDRPISGTVAKTVRARRAIARVLCADVCSRGALCDLIWKQLCRVNCT